MLQSETNENEARGDKKQRSGGSDDNEESENDAEEDRVDVSI